MPDGRLRHQAARAFGWVALGKGSERALGVVRIVVLARLLAPGDFGAFGIAALALATLERMSRPGLTIALVQRQGEIGEYLDPVWSVLLLRSLAMAAVIFFIREPVASFFATPEVARLMVGVSIATALGGFTSVSLHLLQRDLLLGRRTAVIVAASIADAAVSIPAAILSRDAMALVYGMIARNVVLAVASWLAHEYRPRLTFRWGRLRDLKDFALQGTLQSGVFFLVEQGDDAYVGKALGEHFLGIYLVCYRMASVVTQELARTLAEVTLPVFGRVQDDLPRLYQGLREVIGGTWAVILPAVVVLYVEAPSFIGGVLGDAWLEGVAAFRALLVFGLLRASSQALEAALAARGDMRFVSRTVVYQLLTLAALIFPLGSSLGLVGVALAVASSQLLSFGLSLGRLARTLKASRIGVCTGARGPVAGALIGMLVALPLRILVTDWPGWTGAARSAVFTVAFLGVYARVSWPILKRDAPTLLDGVAGVLGPRRWGFGGR